MNSARSNKHQDMEDIRKFGERWLRQMHSSGGSSILPSFNQPKSLDMQDPWVLQKKRKRRIMKRCCKMIRKMVPERAVVAASLARRIASLPPHERIALPSNSFGTSGNNSFYGGMSALVASRPAGQQAEELDERYYEEAFDPVRSMLESLPPDVDLRQIGVESGEKLLQLDVVTAQLSRQVMEHHEDMVAGMQLVTELERDLQLVSIICKNARRKLASASREVSQDLAVASSVRKKQVLTDMIPILLRMQDIVETKGRLEATVEDGNYAKALRMCSECLVMIEECSQLQAIQDMNKGIQEWLTRTVERVDGLLLETCRHFNSQTYASVIDAYAVLDDAPGISEKVQTFFAQAVVSETYEVLRTYYYMASEREDPQLVLKKSRLPYNELCTHLPNTVFCECLHKTLAILFDLLCSYHTMMVWQHPKVVESAVSPQSRSKDVSHKRTGSSPSLLSYDIQGPLTGKATLKSRNLSFSSPPRKFPLSADDVMGTPPSRSIHHARSHSQGPLSLSSFSPSPSAKLSSNSSENLAPGGDFRDTSVSVSSPQRAILGEANGPSTRGRGEGEVNGIGGTESIPAVVVNTSISATEMTAVTTGTEQKTERDTELEVDMERPLNNGGEQARLVSDGESSTDEEEADLAANNLANRMRAETTLAVRKSLERGKKTIWELAARRVGALLSADAMVSSSAHQFLQALEWTNRFILAGEAFSGADAIGLRAKITKQSEKYFKAFHRQSLEVLRMMQERETWQSLPPTSLENINLAGLTGNGAALLTSTPLLPINDSSVSGRGPSVAPPTTNFSVDGGKLGAGDVKSSFADWMVAGNPFREEGTEEGREREREGDYAEQMRGREDGQARKNGDRERGVRERGSVNFLEEERDGAGGAGVGPDGEGDGDGDGDGEGEGEDERGERFRTHMRRTASEKLVENAGNSKSLVANGVSRRVVSSLKKPETWQSHGSVRRIASERSWKGGRGGRLPLAEEEEEEDEDEEESEELMADFIDEDSQKPSGRSTAQKYSRWNSGVSRGGGGGGGGGGGLDNGNSGKVVITGSSVSVLRFMDRYARLMQILQPIAGEVFKGLCQLFDLYLLAIFRTFGQREAFTVARIQNETPTTALLTPRLRATLVRISQGLDEYRMKTPASSNSSSDIPPPVNSHPGNIVSPGNLYGLRERCVATESIVWLADFMRRCRPQFQSLLPQSALPAMEHFYSRTVEAVPDLREHVYKTLSRLLMNVGGYADRIANVRWEAREVGVDHNQYVDQLVGEYRMFAHRVAHAGVNRQVQEQLLQYGADAIAEVMVEGFSRVKRCTNEGRALMSLDLQVLVNGLRAVSKIPPNMEIVEHYIKAFYLPETEYLHWARTHSEYTRYQIVGLINLVATTNNWKRKTRTELLEKIDSGEM